MSDQAKLIRFFELHIEAMQLGLDMLKNGSSNGIVEVAPPASRLASLAAPMIAPPAAPKKKTAKKAKRKYTKRQQAEEPLEYDDEDEDDDEQPVQKTTRAVSIGEVRESIGRFIAKLGLGQTFDGNQVRAIFDFELESTTMTAALNFWIDCGAIERIERGNPGRPSVFKKIRVMDGED